MDGPRHSEPGRVADGGGCGSDGSELPPLRQSWQHPTPSSPDLVQMRESNGEARGVELANADVAQNEMIEDEATKEVVDEYKRKHSTDASHGLQGTVPHMQVQELPEMSTSSLHNTVVSSAELMSIINYKNETPWYVELRRGSSPIRFESNFLGFYDILQFVLLSYTALVAPYEVAFVEDPVIDSWWWANRVVDTFFIMDLIFNFIRPTDTGNRARRLSRIRDNYLKFWFWVDCISSIPYDMIGNSKMKSFRLIRLMRLAKLGKLIRASRMVEAYEDRMSIPLSRLESYKLMILVLITCHWMACFWCLIPMTSVDDDDFDDDGIKMTWITALEASKGIDLRTNYQIYVASLYYSVMTLTSVGYGDIQPQNEAEYIACIFLMLVSGIVWAYILGTLTAILSSMDPRNTHFKQTLDDLNFMIRAEGMKPDTAARIRRYWREVQTVNRLKEYRPLIEKMSNGLQSELEHCICRRQFANVEQYEGMCDEFMAELAQLITQCKALYPPGERILTRPKLDNTGGTEPVGRSLCVIMNKGLVGYGGRLIGRKCQKFHWGDDYLLECENLRVLLPATALSYVEVQFVPIEAIHFLLGVNSSFERVEKWAEDPFPEELQLFRKTRIRLAISRGVVKLATLINRMKAEGQMGNMTPIEALTKVGPILKTVGAVDLWDAICAVGMGVKRGIKELERRQKIKLGLESGDASRAGGHEPFARSSPTRRSSIGSTGVVRGGGCGGGGGGGGAGDGSGGGDLTDLASMMKEVLKSQHEMKVELAQLRQQMSRNVASSNL